MTISTRTLLGTPAPFQHDGIPDAARPTGPPSRGGGASEALALVQVARLLRASPWLAFTPAGRGQVVIDVPGWRAPEASMVLLRTFLRLRGYDTRSWGAGRKPRHARARR